MRVPTTTHEYKDKDMSRRLAIVAWWCVFNGVAGVQFRTK